MSIDFRKLGLVNDDSPVNLYSLYIFYRVPPAKKNRAIVDNIFFTFCNL